MQGVEALLRQLHVRWLVLPSIKSVLAMWRYSFSFIPLTLEEQAALEPHIVSPGTTTTAKPWTGNYMLLVLLTVKLTHGQPHASAHVVHCPGLQMPHVASKTNKCNNVPHWHSHLHECTASSSNSLEFPLAELHGIANCMCTCRL